MEITFRACDAGASPACELISAALAEYDVIAGRALQGGPLTSPADFAPPGGAYLVGFAAGEAVCGGGVKRLGPGMGEIKRLYVVPRLRRHGVATALLSRLEEAARELGYGVLRLDSHAGAWPLYAGAGYHRIADYNGNPHAAVWAEKRIG